MEPIESSITRALSVPQEIERRSDEIRSKIFQLEKEILKITQTDIPTKHHFAPGIYMREIFVPKGTVITGAIHKTEHLNILSQGEMSVWTEDGPKRVKASTVVKSQPGIKRAGYAHEDSVWITVCHNETNESDIDKLFNLFTTNSYEEFLEFTGQAETKHISNGGA